MPDKPENINMIIRKAICYVWVCSKWVRPLLRDLSYSQDQDIYSERFTLPKYYCIRGMGYAKIRIFRGNKKEQVLDNLAEKNRQVSGSRIRGTSVST